MENEAASRGASAVNPYEAVGDLLLPTIIIT